MQQITLAELLAQETKRDPIAFAARLREQGSLVRLTAPLGRGDGWIATGYDDAIAILKDPRFVKDIQKLAPPRDEQVPGNERASVMDRFLVFRRDMLSVDPPDHTRLRSLVSKAFTPRMIEQLRPRIQQVADELLDAVQAQGRMDLIADFAFPLPITVISEMLGISYRGSLALPLLVTNDRHRDCRTRAGEGVRRAGGVCPVYQNAAGRETRAAWQ